MPPIACSAASSHVHVTVENQLQCFSISPRLRLSSSIFDLCLKPFSILDPLHLTGLLLVVATAPHCPVRACDVQGHQLDGFDIEHQLPGREEWAWWPGNIYTLPSRHCCGRGRGLFLSASVSPSVQWGLAGSARYCCVRMKAACLKTPLDVCGVFSVLWEMP